MKKLMTRVAVAAIGAGLIATGATAATPASGTIGKASPKIKYTGNFVAENAYKWYQVWEADPSVDCGTDCDKYALKVTDPGKLVLKFELGVVGDTGNGYLGIKIQYPNGDYSFDRLESAPKAPAAVTIAKAEAGDYEISIVSNLICCGSQSVTSTGDWSDPNAPATSDPAPSETPAPSGGGGGSTPPSTQPAAPAAFTVDAKAGKVSAKKAKKGKSISVKATSSRAIERMTLTLKKGSKTVGTATKAPFPGSATMKVKLSKALKKGTYTLVVAGQDGSTTSAKTIKVKVTK